MTHPIRVVVVDDHGVLLEGLKKLLEMQGQISVVGEAQSADEALSVLEKVECDVVLMDIGLTEETNGIECTRLIKERYATVRVLILSMYTDHETVVWALKAGADGYVIKSASSEDLLRAVIEVASHRTYIHPRIAGSVVAALRASTPPASTPPRADLTAREHDMLRLLSAGRSNREIAGELFLTENTVKSHLSSLYRKIAVTDRTQAVLYAMQAGIVRSAK